jgi:ubiquinone/menaquinone biosynthesis C-methylase UbiE/Holliday junction resolvase
MLAATFAVSRISTADLRKWRRRGFYSEGALVKLLEKNNYHAVRVPVSNPSLHPLPDVIARREKHVYAFEVKNAGYYAYFPKQQIEKLFRFLDELVPIPNQQKHPVLAAHLGKRWIFKELKWEDWQQGVLVEQERIVKRDKGNFDLETGEKRARTKEELPGLVFDKMGKYWDILTSTHPTEKEVDLIEKVIDNDGLMLDLCCGTGRHDISLVKKGWQIVGADLSGSLLRIAKSKMQEEDISFPLVQCEMQSLPFRSEVFSSVINMFTSFGYLPSEKEDAESLKEIARALMPDGHFLLDIVNRDHLLGVFKESDTADFGVFTMEEKRGLDRNKMKVTSQWIVTPKDTGEQMVLIHELKLYTLEDLRQMLTSAKLAPKAMYGNYKAEAYSSTESPRLIILAEKQKVAQNT